MADLTDKERWFATPVIDVFCRLGGNGPITVTQLMPLVKWTHDGESFLDVGAGSGTTIDAIDAIKRSVKYKGVDFIPSTVEWLKNTYQDREFEVQDARHLKEEDRSWDTVWSRHVIDHLDGFEQPIDEHCRVANKRVICILWYTLTEAEDHAIKLIFDHGKTYEDEYLNQYSRRKVEAYLEKKKTEGWKLSEYLREVSWQGDKQGKGGDTIICLERN